MIREKEASKMTLELFLKKRRKNKSMTQADLAKHLGLKSPQFISNTERGRCQWPHTYFKKLSTKLDVDMDILIKLRVKDFKDRLEVEVAE